MVLWRSRLDQAAATLHVVAARRLLEGSLAHRHPPVQGDRQGVQEEPDRYEREAGPADIGYKESEEKDVRGDERRGGQPPPHPSPLRHGDQLEPETHDGERPPSKVRLRQVTQATAHNPAYDQPQQDRCQNQDQGLGTSDL